MQLHDSTPLEHHNFAEMILHQYNVISVPCVACMSGLLIPLCNVLMFVYMTMPVVCMGECSIDRNCVFDVFLCDRYE